jgi:hypothetical protein
MFLVRNSGSKMNINRLTMSNNNNGAAWTGIEVSRGAELKLTNSDIEGNTNLDVSSRTFLPFLSSLTFEVVQFTNGWTDLIASISLALKRRQLIRMNQGSKWRASFSLGIQQ